MYASNQIHLLRMDHTQLVYKSLITLLACSQLATLRHRFFLVVNVRRVAHVKHHFKILNVLKIQTTLHALIKHVTLQNRLSILKVNARIVTLVWNQLKITKPVLKRQTGTHVLLVHVTGIHSSLKTTNVQTVLNVRSQISPELHASNHTTTIHAWQHQHQSQHHYHQLQHLPQFQLYFHNQLLSQF